MISIKYNPDIHHRHSVRLINHCYADGFYFVTIRTNRKQRLFGVLSDGVMMLNDAGVMINNWFDELTRKYPHAKLDNKVIMPDHIYCIIGIGVNCLKRCSECDVYNQGHGINQELCARTVGQGAISAESQGAISAESQGAISAESQGAISAEGQGAFSAEGQGAISAEGQGAISAEGQGAHIGAPLHEVIRWFKTMTTNEYIRCVKSGIFEPFDKQVWQRSFYDHKIQNETELYEIRNYIDNNPTNADDDQHEWQFNIADD